MLAVWQGASGPVLQRGATFRAKTLAHSCIPQKYRSSNLNRASMPR